MRARHTTFITLALMASLLVPGPAFSSQAGKGVPVDDSLVDRAIVASPGDARSVQTGTPPAFIPNAGQLTASHVRYYTEGGGLWFTDEGAWFDVGGGEGKDSYAVWQEFVGARAVEPSGEVPLEHRMNFFTGTDRDGWRTGLTPCREVWYRDLWNRIDIRYHTGEDGLKYDIIVRPGGDVDDIRLAYRGADSVSPDGDGGLLVETPAGDLRDRDLYIYQETQEGRKAVRGELVLPGGVEYGFAVTGPYDPATPLVIDPALEFSTLLGGNDGDYIGDMEVDGSGNTVVVGTSQSSNYPTTPGAYQGSSTSGVLVSKLRSDGSGLIFSTVVGDGSGYGLALDAQGAVHVTGYSSSPGFPTTSNAYGTYVDGTLFVFKLSPDGGTLLHSTFIGGGTGYGVDVDPSGMAVVCGDTTDADFPTVTGALDPTYNGGTDGVVFGLDSGGTALRFSTFIGGAYDEHMEAVVADGEGGICIAGSSASPGYPTTLGAFDDSVNGGGDLVVTLMDSEAAFIQYSTYVGGSSYDMFPGRTGLAVDDEGIVYVGGETMSTDFPTTPGAFDRTHNGGLDGYVLKLNTTGGGAADLLLSTYLGGNGGDVIDGLALDGLGSIMVTGSTASTNFPLSKEALDTTISSSEGFLARLDPTGFALIYSGFIGGSGVESSALVDVGPGDDVFVAGQTGSADMTATSGAYDTSHNGGYTDLFACRISFPEPSIGITSFTLCGSGAGTTTVYTRQKVCDFRVNISDTVSLLDVEEVLLTLDPEGSAIRFLWECSDGNFYKVSDPNGYVTLMTSSKYHHDGARNWTVIFRVMFNWAYLDEEPHDVTVRVTSALLPPAVLKVEDMYRVENDLTLNGDLTVTTGDGRNVPDGGLVRGGAVLHWTGVTAAYQGTTDAFPPKGEYDLRLRADGGDRWDCSPPSGNMLSIHNTAPLETSDGGLGYRVEITGVPTYSDISDVSFTLRTDPYGVTFSDPSPVNSDWHTNATLELAVTIEDGGGAGVDGDSVSFTVLSDEGDAFEFQRGVPCPNATIVRARATATLPEGGDNMVHWEAGDAVGNGPTQSSMYRVRVDSRPVAFSEMFPREDEVFTLTAVMVGASIRDVTSGVDRSSVQYSASVDGGVTWGDWKHVTGVEDDGYLKVQVQPEFVNGTGNRVRWRAADIAGNGPMESPPITIRVDTRKTVTVDDDIAATLNLQAPENGTTLRSRSVKLDWEAPKDRGGDVTYEVYVDTSDPPLHLEAKVRGTPGVTLEQLDDGTTYFWTVVPVAGGVRGSCLSGVWSFTLEIPATFGVEMEAMEGMDVAFGAGARVTKTLRVTNTGESEDTITIGFAPGELEGYLTVEGEGGVRLKAGGSMGVVLIFAGVGDILSGDGADAAMGVVMVVTVSDGTPAGDFPVTLEARSEGAARKGLDVSDRRSYMLHVDRPAQQEKTGASEEERGGGPGVERSWAVYLVWVPVLILSLLGCVFIAFRRRGKKRGERIGAVKLVSRSGPDPAPRPMVRRPVPSVTGLPALRPIVNQPSVLQPSVLQPSALQSPANQSSAFQPSANQLPVDQPPAAVELPEGAVVGAVPMASPAQGTGSGP